MPMSEEIDDSPTSEINGGKRKRSTSAEVNGLDIARRRKEAIEAISNDLLTVLKRYFSLCLLQSRSRFVLHKSTLSSFSAKL
jgi:hypothetical protein